MGCLSEGDREEFLRRFWEAQERIKAEFVRRLARIREEAAREEDPYRRRLLSWAAENWGMIETLAYEDAPGLYGTAYAALPQDLRADMHKQRVSADPDRALSAEDRERIEIQELRYEERERTGGPCPETEAKFGQISQRRRQRGEKRITPERIKEIHRRIVQASAVHDPEDLLR